MYFIYAAAAVVLTIADLFVKHIVRINMKIGQTIPVIKDVFHITYAKNTGVAFSMFADNPEIMTWLTVLLLVLLVGFIIYTRPKNHLVLCSFALMISGGIGNLINRVTLGYVVDFFDFRLINFAIFNTADVFIVTGACLFILHTFLTADRKGEKSENKSE